MIVHESRLLKDRLSRRDERLSWLARASSDSLTILMESTETTLLTFEPPSPPLPAAKLLRDGLSAVIQIGATLWVANDETISLERLSFLGQDEQGTYHYGAHQSFPLSQYLSLPVPPPAGAVEVEEIDIEGLAYQDGYLWLVGSHSLKRKKAQSTATVQKNFRRFADVSREGNRFLLARIPLIDEGGLPTLAKQVVAEDGTLRRAAQIPADAKGSLLTRILQEDEHLRAFLDIPGKDNGFDIEGLAVADNRIFLGLRGPVLRGWAIVLELEVEATNSAQLRLNAINSDNPHNPDHPTYRKHFLRLDGLGVRDLCVRGSDLLILAGPTQDLDGPVTLYCWPGGAQPPAERVVFKEQLITLRSISFGEGDDHAEGMTLFQDAEREGTAVLVVYDTCAAGRKVGETGVKADIFSLP